MKILIADDESFVVAGLTRLICESIPQVVLGRGIVNGVAVDGSDLQSLLMRLNGQL